MKIERWDTREIIFDLECNSWTDLVRSAIKAKVSFFSANLRYADLRYADLRGADLRGADLSDADLRYADLRYADLSDSNLRGADLRYADLRYADLRGADLRYADLSDSNLRGADLRYADLRYADLRYANGNLREVSSLHIDTYHISFDKNKLNIGCQSYTFQEWKDFTDEQISEMDADSLTWWNKWKDFIFKAIELKFGEV